ncbi:SDR family NAD(P)-dependent oxidoreductase [Streptomyces cinereospinus]|uniref:SDR family NAD(P)-dependent oxidoreductase n=1 Tax=Streptomyces cinereospinus TaxID=285561 RepID=A0ABV5N8J7_9ACTN
MGYRLQGKTALITGSTSNIGRGVALAYARESAHVVVSGRSAERGAQVVEEIRAAGGRADFVAADLDGSAAASQALADDARAVLGGQVDILVNNAGIFPAQGTLATDEATFDRVFAVNVKAPFFLTAALVPGMVEAGGGAVINLGSWAVRQGLPQGVAYSASKGSLETLTRAWSAEFGPRGVRVNAISPGVVLDIDPEEAGSHPAGVMMKGTPYGSTGTPDAIGQAAVYLGSDESSFVHGTVLDVDGGRTTVAVIAA